MSPTLTAPHPVGLAPLSRLAHLRVGLGATLLLAPAVALVGGLYAGPAGVVAGLVAIAVVALSFIVSTLAVAAADKRDPALVLPVGLGTYAAKVVVLGVAAFSIAGGNAAWNPVAGWSVVAATITWTVAHAVWFWRTPRPYVVFPDAHADVTPPRASQT